MHAEELEPFHSRVIDELAVLRTVLDNILAQTTKTNGRVSSLETRANGHDIIHAIDVNNKNKADWWKEKLGTAILGIICAAIGFTVLIVLQRTNVVDVSSVSPEQYDSLPE
jgi:hypothetical protein